MTTCHRGDVVLLLFPNSDLRTYKRRPALVVQANQLHTELDQTIVAMITSNPARAGHPSRLVLPANSQNGLMMDSIVMTDNLATIRNSEIDRVVGRVTDMTELDVAMRATLAL